MNEKKNRANPWIILHPMILGTVLGVLAGGVVCYFQTKMYVSRAVLAAKGEPDGRTVDLAPIHAAQAIFLTDGTMGKPDGDAVKSLCRNTRVRAADGFVEIVVADPDKVRARDIATELTWLIRGMDAEASLGGAASDLPAISEDARELMEQRLAVERLMREQSIEATGFTSFRLIPALARAGSREAFAVAQSETFQRHWQFHEMTTNRLLGQPMPDLPLLPLVKHPEIAERPSSPNVDLYLRTGLLAGLGLGGIIGFRRSRRIASADNFSPNSPVDSPIAMQRKHPSLSSQQPGRHAAEEDW